MGQDPIEVTSPAVTEGGELVEKSSGKLGLG